MGLSNRAIGMGIMASLLVIAAVCVFNDATAASPAEIVAESKSSTDISNLRGTALLAAEAHQIDAAREVFKQGRDMKSVDTMIKDFQTKPDQAFADVLTKAATKEDEWAIAPPKADGTIPQKIQGVSAPDESMDYMKDDGDDILVQTAAEEWQPHGQKGLGETIQQVTADEQAAQDAKDGISSDDDILTGGGIAEEMDLFQRPPTSVKAKKEEDEPKDNSVVVHKLPVAKTFESVQFDEGNKYDEEHYKAPADEFEGDGILSAVGIKDAAQSETELLGKISDDDFNFDFHA